MADNLENDKDRLGDNWVSSWEAQCVDEWESDSNMDEPRAQTENEHSLQKLWSSFQNSASSIAQLYKEGSQHGVSLWVPFQNSASSVTILHKDSQEAMKKAFDLGCQHGSHRRTRDLLNWARKKRRHIRREDLVGYLCGKTPPIRSHHHHRSNASLSRTPTRVSVSMDRACSPRHNSESKCDENETDLQPFREALALQGLNGAMSNISVGHGSPRGGCGTPSISNPQVDDFHYFILDEMARRCDTRKRSSSSDTRIDSPNRKRSRFCHNTDPDM